MNKDTLHIGYFADGPWAHKAFHKLIADKTIQIQFICVRFDNRDPVLCNYAKKFNIDLLFLKNVNEDASVMQLKKYQCDLFVSMSFNQIFKRQFLNIPPHKTINCHAGKLPYYRGRNVLNWVLINDEKEFGITVHYVDEGIDTGDIILQKTYPITDDDTYATLLEIAYEGCAELLYRSIKQIQTGAVHRIEQKSIDKIGLYCGQRREGDEIIDWNQDSRTIFNFVRALTRPGVGATSYIGGEEIKIYKVGMIEGAHKYINIPGQIIGKDEKGFIVKTKDTMVYLEEYECKQRLRIGMRLNDSNKKGGGYTRNWLNDIWRRSLFAKDKARRKERSAA